MKSVLEDYPRAKAEVMKAAEVAGYLWQKGWAERNGGNITRLTSRSLWMWKLFQNFLPLVP